MVSVIIWKISTYFCLFLPCNLSVPMSLPQSLSTPFHPVSFTTNSATLVPFWINWIKVICGVPESGEAAKTARGWSGPWTAAQCFIPTLIPHSHKSFVFVYKCCPNPEVTEIKRENLEGENNGGKVRGGLHSSVPTLPAPHPYFTNQSSFFPELFQPITNF